ncbi:MAG: hypothetical protein AAF740_13150, partial [Bacteroidota bacterium]
MIHFSSRFHKLVLSFSFFFVSLHGVWAETPPKVIHTFVALCDNATQSIVPVPERIGNGDDPFNNLYWGCGYGVKTFFKNDPNWTLLKSKRNRESGAVIMERLIFKHKTQNAYLVADAYRGSQIKTALNDYFDALHGVSGSEVKVDGIIVRIGGYADLITYIGHNGLMEFDVPEIREKKIFKKRSAIAMACYTKEYFEDHFKLADVHPLLLTTHLMAPEAYTLAAVLEEWLKPD